MQFEKWYKQWVESSAEDPPENVWEGIQDELDVDNVWFSLSRKIGTGRILQGSQGRILLAVAASLLLLVISAGLLFYLSENKQSGEFTAEATYIPEINADRIQSIPAGSFTVANIYAHPLNLNKKKGYNIRQETMPVSRINGLPSTGVIQTAALTLSYRQAGSMPVYIDIPEENITGMPSAGYFFGLSAQLANTWMMNDKTYSGLQAASLTQTRPSFGKSFGLLGGITLSASTELQLALDILSQKRQEYNEYIHGRYVSTSLDMDYTKLSLTAHYRPWQHRPHRAVAGGYWGYLNNASNQVNGSSEQIRDMYSRADYGITGGYEYLHHLGDNLRLTTGLYANHGLTNVFAGNEYIPSYLGRTRHLSFHLGISLRYNINP